MIERAFERLTCYACRVAILKQMQIRREPFCIVYWKWLMQKNIKCKENSNIQVFYFSCEALVQLIKYHLIMIMYFIDLLNVFFSLF